MPKKRLECGILSILSYRGKPVITSAPELQAWCNETLAKRISPQWCFEAGSLISIDRKLAEYGYRIDQAHAFFTPHFPAPDAKFPVKLLGKAEIAQLESDERIYEAFLIRHSSFPYCFARSVAEGGACTVFCRTDDL